MFEPKESKLRQIFEKQITNKLDERRESILKHPFLKTKSVFDQERENLKLHIQNQDSEFYKKKNQTSLVNKKGIPFQQSNRMLCLIDQLLQIIEDYNLEDHLELKVRQVF